MLKVKLLGHFQLWRDNEPIPAGAWPQRKAQAVLKLLLSQRGQLISQDQLIEHLFSHLEPDQAVRNLQSRISEVRRLIEPQRHNGKGFQYILRIGQGYCFNKTAPCEVDAEAFENTIQDALKAQEAGHWDQAKDQYRQAIALYDGGYLAEDRYEEWTFQIREHYLQLYLAALEQLAICHARVQHYHAAIECCDNVIEKMPRESLYRQKMLYHSHANERELALQTYHACVQRLKSELDAEPSLETRALYQQILMGQAPKPAKVIPHNLPAPGTSFIGRERELKEIEELLETPQCRMLNMTGLGGIGKTRLALEAARKQLAKESFKDGVYFVSLAGVSSPELVVNTIADAVKFSFFGQDLPEEQLLNYLREKEMLLLLDNFEHLRQQAAYLSRMVQKAPKVKLLITSRERLNLEEEWLFEVRGLEVPAGGKESQLEAHESTRLFVERAKQVGLKVTPQEKPWVAEICRLVQGMPLGIEMTATWTRVMSCEQITRGIAQGLDLLAAPSINLPERHRNMRAVFEHSWRLLSKEEQDIFRRLSIFRGGFQMEAATHVAGLTLPLLSSLLDKCLVSRSKLGRCELHELLRQFAEEKLKKDEEVLHKTRDLYCGYFAEFLHQREVALDGANQKQAVQEIESEVENVRASWDLSIIHDQFNSIAKSLGSFYTYLDLKSQFREGERIFAQAIDKLKRSNPSLENQIRASLLGELLSNQGFLQLRLGQYSLSRNALETSLKCLKNSTNYKVKSDTLRRLGHLSRLQGEYSKAKVYFQQSLKICKKAQLLSGIEKAKSSLGIIAFNTGEFVKAQQLHQEGLEISKRIGDWAGIAVALNNLGDMARIQGKYSRAQRLLNASLSIEKQRDNEWGIAISFKNLALLAKQLGRYKEANQLYQKALSIEHRLGDRWASARTLQQMGAVACCLGEFEKATQLLQKSLAISKEIKDQWTKAMALISLGQLAYSKKQLSQANRKFGEGLAICRRIGRPVGVISSLAGLGAIAVELKEYQKAKGLLHEALDLAMKKQATPLILEVLGEAGNLLVHTNHEKIAVEVLGFVRRHKASEKRVKDHAKRLLEIKPSLPRADLKKTAKRRKEKPLARIVSQVLGCLDQL